MIKSSIFVPSSKFTHWLIGASTIFATNFCLASASQAFTLTSSGNITGGFNNGINGIAVNSSNGDVYVLDIDGDTDRIQNFDKTGSPITNFVFNIISPPTIDPDTSLPIDPNPNLIPPSPRGIAVDSLGNFFITDINFPIQKFDGTLPSNQTPTAFGTLPSPNTINSIAIDSAGNVFVADTSAIQKLDKANGNSTVILNTATNAIALDSSNNIVFIDSTNNNLNKYDVINSVTTTINTSLSSPTSIAVDNVGNIIFVAETGNSIKAFDSTSGSLLFQTNLNNVTNSSFLAVDGTNKKLYVTDSSSVQIFNFDPTAVPFEFSPNLGIGALGIVVAAKQLHKKKQQEKQKNK